MTETEKIMKKHFDKIIEGVKVNDIPDESLMALTEIMLSKDLKQVYDLVPPFYLGTDQDKIESKTVLYNELIRLRDWCMLSWDEFKKHIPYMIHGIRQGIDYLDSYMEPEYILSTLINMNHQLQSRLNRAGNKSERNVEVICWFSEYVLTMSKLKYSKHLINLKCWDFTEKMHKAVCTCLPKLLNAETVYDEKVIGVIKKTLDVTFMVLESYYNAELGKAYCSVLLNQLLHVPVIDYLMGRCEETSFIDLLKKTSPNLKSLIEIKNNQHSE
jgi:hypothetical protein